MLERFRSRSLRDRYARVGTKVVSAAGALIAVACSDARDFKEPGAAVPVLDHSHLKPTSIAGELVSNATAIGRPKEVRLSSSVLWVSDLASNPALHALDLATGQILYSFGPRGDGPGEFRTSPFGLSIDPSDSTSVMAFDLSARRVTQFRARPVAENQFVALSVEGTPSIQRLARVSADRFIGQSQSDTARFVILTDSGSRVRNVAGTVVGPDSIPIADRLRAANSGVRMCGWYDRGFVLAQSRFGLIEYFDVDGKFLRTASLPYSAAPAFSFDEARRVYALQSERRWYMDCATSRTQLFALFSGRRPEQFQGDEVSSGTFVHVFDIQGNLTGVIQLDRAVSSIDVSAAGDLLVAASLVDAGPLC